MLKLFVSILLTCNLFSQKANFVNEVEVDQSKYRVWYSYVIDSTYWHVWDADGSLPKRENGTYKYWKADSEGNLIPLRKIDYRLPIFQEQSVMMKKEKGFFE